MRDDFVPGHDPGGPVFEEPDCCSMCGKDFNQKHKKRKYSEVIDDMFRLYLCKKCHKEFNRTRRKHD